MLLRTQTAAYLVLAPKKATGKYAKPAETVLISVNPCLRISVFFVSFVVKIISV